MNAWDIIQQYIFIYLNSDKQLPKDKKAKTKKLICNQLHLLFFFSETELHIFQVLNSL